MLQILLNFGSFEQKVFPNFLKHATRMLNAWLKQTQNQLKNDTLKHFQLFRIWSSDETLDIIFKTICIKHLEQDEAERLAETVRATFSLEPLPESFHLDETDFVHGLPKVLLVAKFFLRIRMSLQVDPKSKSAWWSIYPTFTLWTIEISPT